jgi:hypothetical protein
MDLIRIMTKSSPALVVLAMGALLALAAGCTHDRPHEYGERRPPVDEVTADETGLGSKDVVSASDQMAQDLLGNRELNASRTQWTMVVDHIDNRTTSNHFDMDIFLERLRVNLAKYGKGRVALIENREKLRDLQSRELEIPAAGERDDYGQTGASSSGRPAPGPRGVQPDYALYGKVMELPNRGTSYFLCEFTVTDLRTRQQVWTNAYEVKTAR